MQSMIKLVSAVRDLYGSDRKAAPAFGVTQATFSRWRAGDAFPTDDHALKIAELLKLDTGYVLAIIRHDRAESKDARAAWTRIAEQFKDAAVIAALAVGAASFGIAPTPASGAPGTSVHHHLCKIPRRFPKWMLGSRP